VSTYAPRRPEHGADGKMQEPVLRPFRRVFKPLDPLLHAMFTTPIVLVPALPGKMHSVERAVLFKPASIANNLGALTNIIGTYTGGSFNWAAMAAAGALNQTQRITIPWDIGATTAPASAHNMVGTALILTATGGDPVAINSGFEVWLWYRDW